jgi:serine protease Do
MEGSYVRKLVLLLALAVALAPISFASADDEDDKPTPAELVQLAEQLADSLVVVECTVQSDKGETPGSDWRGMRFSSDFSFGPGAGNWDQLIKQERPGEFAGYLLPENRVLTTDPMLHPRFIKRIAVRAGEQLIEATIDAYGRDRNALFLRLKEPARTGKPLVFDTSKPGPYRSVTFFNDDGTWKISAGGVSDEKPKAIVTPGKPPKVTYRCPGLYVDRAGVPVAVVMKSELGLDEDWRQAPDDWPTVSADEMHDLLEQLEQVASKGLLRVNLRFRSPRTASRSSRFGISISFPGEEGSEEMTEWNGTGILTDDRTVLVLANLRPKVTGRLEAIRVFSGDGQEAAAEFAGTLGDYGAFLAKLDAPLPGTVCFETRPIKEFDGELLLKAQVRVLGDARSMYCWRDRVTSFSVGWRRQIYPDVSATSGGDAAPWEESRTPALNFLYTLDGKLIGVPIAKRQKIVTDDRWRGWDPFGADSNMLAAGYLDDVLHAGAKSVDPENRPLTEEEENRLAWLGVELQAMTADLARMNNVADQTANGTTGAMVTYVYPDSPAAAVGLEVGDILLRLHIEGQPKPMEVKLEDEGPFADMMDQFWMIGDQMPSDFFDQMPKPWGAAENALTRALTDVGFGKHFTAEIFRNGQIITKDFVVTEGPPHYDSARRFKSKAAGFTVRDVTYEVRRYFQLKPDDPGVIVSKVESGRPAAVAGIKPLELILSVNDEPVHSAADLEKAIADGGEFRLNVKRMTVSRVVTLKIEAESEAD